jgi:hypothetical protein
VQFHRLASLILGIWLGVGIFMDFVATTNFRMVPQTFASMDVRAIESAKQVGSREVATQLLRYYAGEVNRYLFEQWEWTEMALGLALLLVLVFCRSNLKLAIVLCLTTLVIVGVQRFKLTPAIAALGRELAFSDSASRRFAAYHAMYGYIEIGKLVLLFLLAGCLLIRRRAGKRAFVREFQNAGEV